MGTDWKDAVNKIQAYSPSKKIDKDLLDSLSISYTQEEKDISLQLTDKTNFHIELISKP